MAEESGTKSIETLGITSGQDDDSDHLKQCVSAVFITVFYIILLACGVALPIAMIVMGSLNLNDCPAQAYIPIYLIVHGAFCVAASLCSVIKRYTTDEETEEKPKCVNAIQAIFVLFLLAWLIAGSVWVYDLQGIFTSSDPSLANYCGSDIYWFAFGAVTTYWVVLPSIAIFMCCCMWCWANGILASCCGIEESIRFNISGTKINVSW